MSNNRFKRLSCLDNLEIFSAEGFRADFPIHFHDQVCITLVRDGFECTEVEGQQLFSPRGYISLTHEEEVHANPNLNVDTYSFVTYYLAPDLLRYLNQNKQVRFKDRVVFDPIIYHQLLDLADRQDHLPIEETVVSILQSLIDQYRITTDHISNQEIHFSKLLEVLAYMDRRLEEKISLEVLARMCDLSKFQFLRAFKKSKGITPTTYLIIKRIEKAKCLLRKGEPIVAVSLACGFFDQSHFHKYFCRYVGMTPAQYMKHK